MPFEFDIEICEGSLGDTNLKRRKKHTRALCNAIDDLIENPNSHLKIPLDKFPASLPTIRTHVGKYARTKGYSAKTLIDNGVLHVSIRKSDKIPSEAK